jgi:hypothetical protein
MAGNVREWTRDRHAYITLFIAAEDPEGAMTGHFRVFKGGSWKSTPRDLEHTHRDFEDPRYRADDMGFRCVFPIDTQYTLKDLQEYLDKKAQEKQELEAKKSRRKRFLGIF